jgi:hypothetical protein
LFDWKFIFRFWQLYQLPSQAHLQNCEKWLLASCPSVHLQEQLGSHWTDFHEIWYLRIFKKSVKKIQVSWKSDKNKGYFTWRPIYIFYHI